MKLQCTHNIRDCVKIKRGRMSYCRMNGSLHWFILVETGRYSSNAFSPDDKIRMAFSYVPRQTNVYIKKKYKHADDFTFIESNDDSTLSTLSGYNPFHFTKSYVVDTWKMTNKCVIVASKPMRNWTFHRFKKFNRYNILTVVPYFGITDCIGYSNHHFQKA